MSKLWHAFLNVLQDIGDRSGCHQLPERSFHIGGYVFPVCARCTGVFAGQTSAVISIVLGLKMPVFASMLLILVMGLDWFLQHIHLKESNNIRRLLTGICGGFGLIHLYFQLIILGINLFTNFFN